ncbi:dephospho-CoA kinase [Evansella tamaricis]|nr:dephospho-CoA kinase [Evansella tamaricis]
MIIGLTGGIATGKSTVSKMIKERGLPVVDADVIAKKVVLPGEVGYRWIVDYFGKEILTDSMTIDRKKLGTIIFNDAEKRKRLNEIVHPEVRKEMKRQTEELLARGFETIIQDIPLLIESKLEGTVDKILLVYVPEKVQLERLMERDNSTKEEALSRIRSQIPIDEKKNYASAILHNDGTISETEKQLDKLLLEWGIK